MYLKTGVLCLAFFTLGMVSGILGPTILELQCVLDVSYEDIVKILPIRSSGQLMGCLSGCNVFILYIWGKAGQPYLLTIHFCFGLGGLMAPLLASPFLSTGEAPIEGRASNATSAIANHCGSGKLLIYIPYAILGTACLFSGSVFSYLMCYHRHTQEHLSRLAVAHEDVATSDRKDSKWRQRVVVLVAGLFLFSLVSFEIGMSAFIPSFAVLSDHHMTKQMGAYLVSLYWLSYTTFRLVSIPLVDKTGVHRNIVMELGILVVANIFLVPFGNSIQWCLWVGVALVGFGISTMFASVFVLLESYFKVTGRIGSFLTVIAYSGGWVYPIIMGHAIETDPQMFLWLIFTCTASTCRKKMVDTDFLPQLKTVTLSMTSITIETNHQYHYAHHLGATMEMPSEDSGKISPAGTCGSIKGVLCLAFLTLGTASGIPGPTILELQCALGVSYEEIVKILPIRSIGQLLGCLSAGFLYDRFNPLSTLAIAFTVMGICTILTPLASSLLSLSVLAFICAACIGLIDPCCNVFLLYIWGKASQKYLLTIHFCFGVGGLAAPLLASPFLSAGDIQLEGAGSNVTSATSNHCNSGQSLIHIPYAILGAVCLVSAAMFLYLMCFHRDTEEHSSRLVEDNDDTDTNIRRNSKWREPIVVLVAGLFMFALISLETGMNSFIPSFAVLSAHHMTQQMGAYLLSLYWFSYTIFRLFAIPLANKISVRVNIIMELGILVVANIFLVPFGNSVEWCLWVGVALIGSGISTMFASVFVLVESYFKVTGRIGSFLSVAAYSGSWIFPAIMGNAIESDPQMFLWATLACTCSSCLLFAILSWLLRIWLSTKPDSENAITCHR
ncbi:Major facilitator superfamily domain-containing protein 4A [Halotydeus destructor]|nr:Major facilitator superfamily domain-containing protein 4A [Halotydeus destructor]